MASSVAIAGAAGTTRWVSTVVPTCAPCSVMTEWKPAIRWTKLSRYSCRMPGRLTYVPRPCSRTRWPSATSPSTARRRVIRLTPYSAHSTGSGGSSVCSGSAATRRRRCSRTDRYFGPVTGLTTGQRYGIPRRLVVMSYETSHPSGPQRRPGRLEQRMCAADRSYRVVPLHEAGDVVGLVLEIQERVQRTHEISRIRGGVLEEADGRPVVLAPRPAPDRRCAEGVGRGDAGDDGHRGRSAWPAASCR